MYRCSGTVWLTGSVIYTKTYVTRLIGTEYTKHLISLTRNHEVFIRRMYMIDYYIMRFTECCIRFSTLLLLPTLFPVVGARERIER